MLHRTEFVINVDRRTLNLPCMLLGGQTFRWRSRKNSNPSSLMGVVRNCIVEIEQSESCCHVKAHSNCKQEFEEPKKVLEEYLQVNFPIEDFYSKWSCRDGKHFARKAALLPGVRMLRQDPFENVISFICSQNNHISRISQLVSKICDKYGTFIGNLHDEDFYTFPTLSDLLKAQNLENELRALSFGYRAAYIAKAVNFLSKQLPNGNAWLLSLRNVQYEEAKQSLLQIPGIGPKVADCVCLMSLDKHKAVPVDTHVFQIALRDYSVPGLKQKSSLTTNTYNNITNFFQNLFGEYAGWAHTVLFCADLRVVPGIEAQNSGNENESEQKHFKPAQGTDTVKVKRKKHFVEIPDSKFATSKAAKLHKDTEDEKLLCKF